MTPRLLAFRNACIALIFGSLILSLVSSCHKDESRALGDQHYEQFVVATTNFGNVFSDSIPSIETYLIRPARTINFNGTIQRLDNLAFGPIDVLSSTNGGRLRSDVIPDVRIPVGLGSNGAEYMLAFFDTDGVFWTARSTDGAEWTDLTSLGRLEKFNQGGGLFDVSEGESGRPYLYFDYDNNAWRAILQEESSYAGVGSALWSVDLAEPEAKAKLIAIPGGTYESAVISSWPAPAGFFSSTGDEGINTSYSLFDTTFFDSGYVVLSKGISHLSNPPGIEIVDASILQSGGEDILSSSGPGFTSIIGSEVYLSTSRARAIPGETGFNTSDLMIYKNEDGQWTPFNTLIEAAAPTGLHATSIAADQSAVVVSTASGGTSLYISRILENQTTYETIPQPWELMSLPSGDPKNAPVVIGPYRPAGSQYTGEENDPCVGPVNYFEFRIQKIGRVPERDEVFDIDDEEDLQVNIEIVSEFDSSRTYQRFPTVDPDSVADGSWSPRNVNLVQGWRPATSLVDLIKQEFGFARGQSLRVTIIGSYDDDVYSVEIPFDELMRQATTETGRFVRAGAKGGERLPRTEPVSDDAAGWFAIDWNVSVNCAGFYP